MANVKISGLTSAGTLTGSEVAPIVQSGTTVKVTTQNIANLAIPYTSYVSFYSDGFPYSTSEIIFQNNTGKAITMYQSGPSGWTCNIPNTTLNKVFALVVPTQYMNYDTTNLQQSGSDVNVNFTPQATYGIEVYFEIRIYP